MYLDYKLLRYSSKYFYQGEIICKLLIDQVTTLAFSEIKEQIDNFLAFYAGYSLNNI